MVEIVLSIHIGVRGFFLFLPNITETKETIEHVEYFWAFFSSWNEKQKKSFFLSFVNDNVSVFVKRALQLTASTPLTRLFSIHVLQTVCEISTLFLLFATLAIIASIFFFISAISSGILNNY